MVSEWKKATIEEVAEKVGMGPFGSSIKVETFVDEGIPIISGQHLCGTRLADLEHNYLTIEHAERLKNANVYRGDIIFTHAGNIGQVAYIPETSRFDRYVISQRQFYMRCDRSKVIPEFITYFFKAPEGQQKLLANTSSSGVPSIAQPVSYLKTIEVPIPPLPEQHAIAHIIGTLDDKIELNRCMNQTLEAMAQALFRSWFVDFEPFRDQGMQESPLGEIPVGWRVGILGDLATVTSGKRPDRRTSTEDEGMRIPLYGGGGPMGYVEKPLYGTPILVTGRVGTLGMVFRVTLPCWPSDNTLVVLAGNARSYEYLYFIVASIDYDALNRGSTQPLVTQTDLQKHKLIIPANTALDGFHSVVWPIFCRVDHNINESTSLAAIRNTLLPKLLSGELRVKDAEKSIKEEMT